MPVCFRTILSPTSQILGSAHFCTGIIRLRLIVSSPEENIDVLATPLFCHPTPFHLMSYRVT